MTRLSRVRSSEFPNAAPLGYDPAHRDYAADDHRFQPDGPSPLVTTPDVPATDEQVRAYVERMEWWCRVGQFLHKEDAR